MTLNEQDQRELAEKLAKLSYRKARREIRRLDPEANLKLWRNGVGPGEIHTMYELPTYGVRVILVEQGHGKMNDRGGIRKSYLYTEARVEPL